MVDWIGRTLGNYRIVEQIGRGGMATVYKAYQPALERYVAIKIIHEQLAAQDEQFFKRFQREAKGVATLRHPNIVQVFDFGIQDDVSYMVMEYLAGVSLKTELKRLNQKGETMSLEEAQRIFQTVANAVDYAYGQGIVHRDLKPDNVILTTKGNVVLTDFGIAKIVGGTQYTVTGAVMGTPAYMSPEQGKGEGGDERSDIYSLGIMLYEMVTGQVPFEADTPLAVIFKHISDPLPLPRKLNPAIPEEVEQVILKALAKNPENRYQRAVDMVNALNNAMVVEAMSLDSETGVSETATADKIMLSGETSFEAAPPSSVHSLHAEALPHRPRILAGIPPWMWAVGGIVTGALLVMLGTLTVNKVEGPTATVSAVAYTTEASVLVAVPSETPTPVPLPTDTPIPKWTDTFTPPPTSEPTDTPTSKPTHTPAPTNTSLPTSTPVPAPTQTLTATPIKVLTAEQTTLYVGPGSIGYEQLAELPISIEVILASIYGNFVKVEVDIAGTIYEGFISTSSIAYLPANLPELTVDQVPWLVRKNYTANGPLTHRNEEGGWSSDIIDTNIVLNGPFELQVQLEGLGQANAIMLYGQEAQSSDWWYGIKRFEVGLDENGTWVFINFFDGTKQTTSFDYHFLKPSDGFITIRFDQQGKNVMIFNRNGKVMKVINVPDIGDFPDGLFPHGIKRIELSSFYQAQMTIYQLFLSTPPTGE